jgi:hypothetical protein
MGTNKKTAKRRPEWNGSKQGNGRAKVQMEKNKETAEEQTLEWKKKRQQQKSKGKKGDKQENSGAKIGMETK